MFANDIEKVVTPVDDLRNFFNSTNEVEPLQVSEHGANDCFESEEINLQLNNRIQDELNSVQKLMLSDSEEELEVLTKNTNNTQIETPIDMVLNEHQIEIPSSEIKLPACDDFRNLGNEAINLFVLGNQRINDSNTIGIKNIEMSSNDEQILLDSQINDDLNNAFVGQIVIESGMIESPTVTLPEKSVESHETLKRESDKPKQIEQTNLLEVVQVISVAANNMQEDLIDPLNVIQEELIDASNGISLENKNETGISSKVLNKRINESNTNDVQNIEMMRKSDDQILLDSQIIDGLSDAFVEQIAIGSGIIESLVTLPEKRDGCVIQEESYETSKRESGKPIDDEIQQANLLEVVQAVPSATNNVQENLNNLLSGIQAESMEASISCSYQINTSMESDGNKVEITSDMGNTGASLETRANNDATDILLEMKNKNEANISSKTRLRYTKAVPSMASKTSTARVKNPASKIQNSKLKTTSNAASIAEKQIVPKPLKKPVVSSSSLTDKKVPMAKTAPKDPVTKTGRPLLTKVSEKTGTSQTKPLVKPAVDNVEKIEKKSFMKPSSSRPNVEKVSVVKKIVSSTTVTSKGAIPKSVSSVCSKFSTVTASSRTRVTTTATSKSSSISSKPLSVPKTTSDKSTVKPPSTLDKGSARTSANALKATSNLK